MLRLFQPGDIHVRSPPQPAEGVVARAFHRPGFFLPQERHVANPGSLKVGHARPCAPASAAHAKPGCPSPIVALANGQMMRGMNWEGITRKVARAALKGFGASSGHGERAAIGSVIECLLPKQIVGR